MVVSLLRRRASFQKLSSSLTASCSRYASPIVHRFVHIKTSSWEHHIEQFQSILGTANVKSNNEDMSAFTTDWTRHYSPSSSGAQQCVVLPRSTEEIQSVVKYCNKHNLCIIPQGGNTGLVGGAAGVENTDRAEVFLSTSRMNQIMKIDTDSSTLVCEAGCILQSLNEALAPFDLTMPLDLGSKGQCQIGGNVATNAGGLNVIRYGPLRAHVLGLEVVTGDGRVMNMLRGHRKDNMGYPSHSLFIGSEGTLGIITKVCMAVVPQPRHKQVLLLLLAGGFQSHVPRALRAARSCLGEAISAFEFMDHTSITAVQRVYPALFSKSMTDVMPAGSGVPSCGDEGIDGQLLLLIECSSANEIGERLPKFIEEMTSQGLLAANGDAALMSSNGIQERQLWALRENVPVALAQLARCGGKLLKHDISLPLSEMSGAIADVKRQLRKEGYNIDGAPSRSAAGTDFTLRLQLVCFGHAGDENLHLNCLVEAQSADCASAEWEARLGQVKASLERAVVKAVVSRKGSLSAEHGVGQKNRDLMLLSRSTEELAFMRDLKRLLDPNGVLNPSKVLPSGY